LEKIKGRIDAIERNRTGVKIDGKWYNVEQDAQKFIPEKGKQVIAQLKNGKISFIKESKEAEKKEEQEVTEPEVERKAVYTAEDIKEMIENIRARLFGELKWALIATNDAILEAEKELQKKFNFTNEDIEKLAAMLFIQFQREYAKLKNLIEGDDK